MKLLDEYITSTGILYVEDRQYDDVINITFKNAVKSIAKIVIKNKKELPNENCLFILTCKIYKLKEYMEAHKKEVKRRWK